MPKDNSKQPQDPQPQLDQSQAEPTQPELPPVVPGGSVLANVHVFYEEEPLPSEDPRVRKYRMTRTVEGRVYQVVVEDR